MERRPFKVVVDRATTEEFEVDARTPEEAESIVEQLMAEGEVGERLESDYIFLDIVPADDGNLETE